MTDRYVEFPGPDQDLRDALEEANIPALLMVLVQLTGDAGLLDGAFKPSADTSDSGDVFSTEQPGMLFGEGPHGLSEAQQRDLRERVFREIVAFRERGRALPPPPDSTLLKKMMDISAGEAIPDEYLQLLREEMRFDPPPEALGWTKAPTAEVLKDYEVLVIGAGMAGLCTAIKLREAGIPFVVIEKNRAVGGTWYENRYPGCGVDTPNHFYSYSFEPNHDWSGYFSKRDELQAYFEHCATKYQVRDAIRFETSVVKAEYDETDKQWHIQVRDRDGREETLVARFLISGTGQLNRPRRPEIRGAERFAGPNFHSAQWEEGHDLTGKRVAIIGTGASAMQIVPSIAGVAKQVTIFQRSAQWAINVPDYHRKVSERKKWLLKHLPYYAGWYRFNLFWNFSDKTYPAMIRDPEWGEPATAMNAASDAIREMLTAHIKSEVGDDPELLAKVLPTYPPFGKRMLLDNHWFRTLKRDDVELVTDPIREITEDAVVTGAGDAYQADILIYSTGFYTNRYLYPMEIVGKKGVAIGEHWGEDPRAYLGITVPEFPNHFILYGPNTNLSHGGSIIFHAECQVRYILGCLKLMIENDLKSIECKQDVHDEYNELVDSMHEERVWAHKGVTSWYQNKHGRVTSVSPWRLVDYWNMTREPNADDFHLE